MADLTRRSFALGTLFIAGSLVAPGALFAANETVVLRLAHINSESDPKHQEALKFKELVEAKTGGAVRVEVYGSGVLGDVREIIEGLQLGTNEIVIEGFGTIPSYSRLSLLDLAPFLYRDRDHFSKVWHGELGREILDAAGAEAGMKLFGPSYRGVRVVTSTRRFSTVEELQGLKIRVPSDDMSVQTWQALGASPTPMAMTEVMTGLQQGTIEAQENPPILSFNFGLADVCDYLIETNHRWSADVFMMDAAFFAGLSPEHQQAILEAGNEAAAFVEDIITSNESAYIDKWREAGAEIIQPDLSSFRDAAADVVKNGFPDLLPWVERIIAVK